MWFSLCAVCVYNTLSVSDIHVHECDDSKIRMKLDLENQDERERERHTLRYWKKQKMELTKLWRNNKVEFTKRKKIKMVLIVIKDELTVYKLKMQFSKREATFVMKTHKFYFWSCGFWFLTHTRGFSLIFFSFDAND